MANHEPDTTPIARKAWTCSPHARAPWVHFSTWGQCCSMGYLASCKDMVVLSLKKFCRLIR
jgi:hypothetical protein